MRGSLSLLCCAVTEETCYRRGGRRLVSIEEDTPLRKGHRTSNHPVLLTSDSTSEGEGESDGEGEGEGAGEREGEGGLLSRRSKFHHSENAVPDEKSGTKPFPSVPRSKLLSFAYRKSPLSANSVREVEKEMEPVEGEVENEGQCEEKRRGGLCGEGREPVEGGEEKEREGKVGGYKEEKEALVSWPATELADSENSAQPTGVSGCNMERREH